MIKVLLFAHTQTDVAWFVVAGAFGNRLFTFRSDSRGSKGATLNLDLSSLTFLVVEDSAYMRTILRTMLQGFGARRIVEAEDGASGLEAMTAPTPTS